MNQLSEGTGIAPAATIGKPPVMIQYKGHWLTKADCVRLQQYHFDRVGKHITLRAKYNLLLRAFDDRGQS
jgi:hypothetical protein